MWSSRLFWKLFLVYVGLNLTLAVGFLLAVTSWQRNEINQQVEQRLHDTAVVLRGHVRRFLSAALDEKIAPARRVRTQGELQAMVKQLAAETKTRLTIVDSRGGVLADSERVFSRAELIDTALGEDTLVMERTIDVHVRALRRKLGSRAELIETVRGVGYRFRDPADQHAQLH